MYLWIIIAISCSDPNSLGTLTHYAGRLKNWQPWQVMLGHSVHLTFNGPASRPFWNQKPKKKKKKGRVFHVVTYLHNSWAKLWLYERCLHIEAPKRQLLEFQVYSKAVFHWVLSKQPLIEIFVSFAIANPCIVSNVYPYFFSIVWGRREVKRGYSIKNYYLLRYLPLFNSYFNLSFF